MALIKSNKITELIEQELDFDFRADTVKINTIDEFNKYLYNSSKSNKKIFYRGEKLLSHDRTLLPSIYRDKSKLFSGGSRAEIFDSNRIIEYYKTYPSYFNMYQDVIGTINADNLYPFLSVSQHYFGVSPLIDFTKSIYVALSFSLKNREIFDEDIVIYTIEIKNENDYTNSLKVANKWIENYNVLVFNDIITQLSDKSIPKYQDVKNIIEEIKSKDWFELNVPTAKLIDVPTNDLMEFQQGVFLLLDDFVLVGKNYLTRKIRNEFGIKKYVISKEICPELLILQMKEKPYYDYSTITDLNKIVEKIK